MTVGLTRIVLPRHVVHNSLVPALNTEYAEWFRNQGLSVPRVERVMDLNPVQQLIYPHLSKIDATYLFMGFNIELPNDVAVAFTLAWL